LENLVKGDHFGGRSLLTKEDFAKDEAKLEQRTIGIGPARLSVVKFIIKNRDKSKDC